MQFKRLSEIALIEISNVDKKVKDGETPVLLCNFTDVYNNFELCNEDLTHFMKGTATSKEIDKFKLKRGDVAITKDSETRGDIGMSCYIADNLSNTILGYHCALIRPKEGIDGGYLNACLQSPLSRKYFSNQASGSGQRYTLTLDGIGNVKIPVIPYDKQIKVTKLLAGINKKIRTNNQINDNLQQLISDIYCNWFENFNSPLDDRYTFVYNNILKRNIPVGWSVKKMLDVTFWETNSQPPKSEFTYKCQPGYIRFIQNRDYDSNDHITYIPKTKSLSIVDRYDILMDKYGDAGTVRYGIEGAFNVALAKIGVKKNNMQEYVRCFLSSKPIYNYLHNACMASTRASLSEENIKPLYILVPPDDVLTLFENKVHLIRQAILNNTDENENLTKIRNELLPLLMNGQASVR